MRTFLAVLVIALSLLLLFGCIGGEKVKEKTQEKKNKEIKDTEDIEKEFQEMEDELEEMNEENVDVGVDIGEIQ